MKKLPFSLSTSLILFLLSSCASEMSDDHGPARFSDQNVMRVHEGMTSEEVVTLFGQPNDVRSSFCSLKGTCRTWEYAQKSPRANASFQFEPMEDMWILKEFSIRRME